MKYNVDELQIEVSVNLYRGRGNARITFNLIDANVKTLTNAIAVFKEFFNSIDYTVDSLSLNIDKSFVEIVLSFTSKHQVRKESSSSRLKFIAITSDEGGR